MNRHERRAAAKKREKLHSATRVLATEVDAEFFVANPGRRYLLRRSIPMEFTTWQLDTHDRLNWMLVHVKRTGSIFTDYDRRGLYIEPAAPGAGVYVDIDDDTVLERIWHRVDAFLASAPGQDLQPLPVSELRTLGSTKVREGELA